MKKNVILIPALNPPKEFINYSKSLVDDDNADLIVIDDGSDKKYKYIFEEIAKLKNTIVLTHAINFGKGRGLKTGLNYFINNYKKDEVVGIVTADSDGQHRKEDVIKILNALSKQKKESLIIGTRDFNKDNVPSKSKMGNKITTIVFKLLYGKKIKDTQTGLRGLTYDFAKSCLDIPGERYEYEISMLIKAVKDKIAIKEETIQTIYFDNNSETHFNPINDSIKIYKIIFKEFFKFGISGLTSALLDLFLFTIFYNLFKNNLIEGLVILIPTVLARIISSLYNYTVNRKVVFNSNERNSKTLVRYYILAICQMTISWLLVDNLFKIIDIFHPTIIKVFVDVILFVLSYQIQQKWVFKGNSKRILE